MTAAATATATICSKVEITPTERCAYFKITYPKTEPGFLLLDLFNEGSIQIYPDEQRITGIARSNQCGVPSNFAAYFVAYIDCPFESLGFFSKTQFLRTQTRLREKSAVVFDNGIALKIKRFNSGLGLPLLALSRPSKI